MEGKGAERGRDRRWLTTSTREDTIELIKDTLKLKHNQRYHR